MVTRVIDIVAACDTGDQGDLVFRAIAPALIRGEVVELSFVGVSTVTSSFVNAAFVELLSRVDFPELKARLRIASSTKQINDMIRHRLTREASRIQPAA